MKDSLILLLVVLLHRTEQTTPNLSSGDDSITYFQTERTCWWNEVCKEEFQMLFRCRCPQWSFCRSPGRYYNAYCSITDTGYLWVQPNRVLTLPHSLILTNRDATLSSSYRNVHERLFHSKD